MKIAPGVRVRASSRGFSAGIGPRVARVHVGTRGVGVSSGIGPFGAYGHLGGGGQRSSGSSPRTSGPSRTTLAALERAARQAEKSQEIQRIAAIERELVCVHHEHFPTAGRAVLATPPDPDVEAIRASLAATAGIAELVAELGGDTTAPVAPAPEPVDAAAARKAERAAAREGISVFKRGERRTAREHADEAALQQVTAEEERRTHAAAEQQRALDAKWAELHERRAVLETDVAAEVSRQHDHALRAVREQQEQLDMAWERLQSNEPTTVMASLEQAFADNDAPATPIDCEDGRATVTMLYGHPDVIPQRTPAITPAGKRTLRKRTKSDCNTLYLSSLASHVLATLKEGFAVCPGLVATSVLVVRRDPTPDDNEELVAIYAATFSQQMVRKLDWHHVDPTTVLQQPNDRLLNLKGQAQNVAALDLRDEPELQAVLEQLASVLDVPARTPM
jgi:hypothetical protein